jgi:maltose O-acetyltransferase
LLASGRGKLFFGKNVHIGYKKSPFFLTGYGYVEARDESSIIIIGDNVRINNNLILIAYKSSIEIGANSLLGHSVEITTSDFHSLDPASRLNGSQDYNNSSVIIGKNVFIGSGVKIMKGSVIGDNTVIAQGAVVSGDIPANVIAGGVPAKVLKNI